MREKSYNREQQKTMLLLARNTIESKLKNNHHSLKNIPDYLEQKRSCFVTLHTITGQLRGCIGNIIPFETLYENIQHNALNSAFKDPRFSEIKSATEMEKINIEISVLTKPQSINSHHDIILGRHGIILNSRKNCSVFLPQVATEQQWNINTTLTNLSLKAGLPPNAWQDTSTEFKVFEAIVFKE
jgi:AmmeMemoRadiSam system protein A